MLFDILALISLIVIISLLRSLMSIFPSLLGCLFRKKEVTNLETSMSLHRERDALTYAMILPFCLTVTRFELYRPGFMTNMSEPLIIVITIGIFLAYAILRKLLTLMLRSSKINKTSYNYANFAAYTFFINLTLLLLITGGLLTFLNVSDNVIKTAMFCISGTIYAIYIIRKMQIFTSSCNFFIGFLYLCALEFLPTGILITSALIF